MNTDLEDTPASPELQVVLDEHRTRFADYESLFQDDSSEIKEPIGQTCDRLLCFQVRDSKDNP